MSPLLRSSHATLCAVSSCVPVLCVLLVPAAQCVQVNREVGAAFRKWHVLFGKEVNSQRHSVGLTVGQARREKVLKAVMRMQQVQLVAVSV